jgi:peptidoglycan-associated lipoprotein
MSKVLRVFTCSLILLAVILVPACRTKKTPTPKTVPSMTTPPPPDLSATATVPTTTVAPATDFVQPTAEPTVKTEILPSDIEELNRVVQSRGYVQDAFFGYDEAALSADAQSALTNSANWLKKNGQYNLLIEGHCDERGTEQYNLALGDRRANTVKEYLATLGVDSSRMRTVSYGEERPFDAGHSEESWAKNRRAHLVLVGK